MNLGLLTMPRMVVFARLKKANLTYDYIMPGYDVLHTFSRLLRHSRKELDFFNFTINNTRLSCKILVCHIFTVHLRYT